jgi:cell division protease FtsH
MADESPPRKEPTWRDVARAGARRQSPVKSGQDGGSGAPTGPGWRVTPAPDGRGGGQGGPPQRGPNPRWLIVLLVLGLLALNFYISARALQPAARVQIPYSPTFLHQVQAGNVNSISAT